MLMNINCIRSVF